MLVALYKSCWKQTGGCSIVCSMVALVFILCLKIYLERIAQKGSANSCNRRV
jgi:hypothetical protein